MSILDKIFDYKKDELAHYKRQARLEDLRSKVRDHAYRPLPLRRRLEDSAAPFAVIAEIKQRSPSKGLLRENFDPPAIARDYEEHGAAALSVLTDEHFFGGHLDHLRQVRATVDLPLLRKDFVWDPYQIYAAREAGADAILLIAAMLGRSQIEDLEGLAEELNLSVLLEVHDAAEADLAAAVGARLVGVNNRDLKTFKVDVALSEKLLPRLPAAALKVAESGLDKRETLARLKAAGIGAFLIGEAFMKAKSPGSALKELLQ
ncbi:MAG TPA: indole-3-glycerol phosphate synthase TrpC [bacterium]|nr:indole-3-glycerol phosphate synthase TrpC [bacterium]